MPVDISAIGRMILDQAASVGGETWDKIRRSAPIFVNAYAQSIVDIAAGVASGEISKSDGRMFAENARLLLVQGIANTSFILLAQAQRFINGVLSALKVAINAALPVPLI